MVNVTGAYSAHLQPTQETWGLSLPPTGVSRRVSRRFNIQGSETLADITGPGCIRRIWVTGRGIGRELVLRIYFDGASVPHVEAPLADFFGIMHDKSECNRDGENPERAAYTINTPFLASKPHNGFTCYFPMPFAHSAKITVDNDSERPSRLYYIIDWHEYPDQELTEPMRFCARWRREAPVPDYQDDFLILDADGPGRLVGFVHSVDMLHSRHIMRWSHAGSDNIYIDGEGPFPAFLRGIGGEDTFGTSYGGHCYPAQSSVFSDMPYYRQKNAENTDLQQMVGYRFFVHDEIRFDKSIHLRFGARAHDVATTVYWYSAAPVHPYVAVPPYPQRLPGKSPGRAYDLPLRDTGHWFISGPFPCPVDWDLPQTGPDADRSLHGRPWRRRAALRSFVDFNHVFRPVPSNDNSATLTDVAAVAACELHTAQPTRATLTFGWDDTLRFRLNGAPAVDLGHHPHFRSQSIEVDLHKGSNRLVVLLTNTTGLSCGGWSFSFGAVTESGERLIPQALWPATESKDGQVLNLHFAAGEFEPLPDYRVFVPPYAEEPKARSFPKELDIICSPQTETFPSPLGPVSVTVAAGENTGLGFRWRDPVVAGPMQPRSALVRGEVRANAHPEGEAVSLELTLAGLPPGEYDLVTFHHCHTNGEQLKPVQVFVNGRETERDGWQSTGLNPDEIGEIALRIVGGAPVRVVYTAESAVVLNGFRLRLRKCPN